MELHEVTTIECPECKHKQSAEWQFCHNCGYNIHFKTFFSTTAPSWVTEARHADSEFIAPVAYDETRQKELATSQKAKSWEEGRKKELANYKPEWVKRGRNTKELSELK